MSLRAEVWTRPGDPAFAKKIADLPVLSHTFTTRRNGVGDGQVILPDSYPRLSEIYDAPDGAAYGGVHSLIRVFDETTMVAELLPTAVVPQQSKGDHVVTVDTIGIESILAYGRLEVFDWDGTDDHVSLFPDWKFGAENKITDGDFEGLTGTGATYELVVADESYTLSFTATGGTFTLTVGGNTTAAIAYNASASTIDTELENLASVTTTVVSTNEAGVHTIQFKNPEDVSPDMTINTGGLTGGTATLTKLYDGFTKTGTTFTLTVDAATTSAIAWNASANVVENTIQALSTVADVTVVGEGTQEDPWSIVFYVPAAPGTFTVDDTNLTGGTAVLTQLQIGEDSFGSWTTSRFADQRVNVAEHGEVSTFQLVADTISGDPVTALEFKASKQFGGAQTIVDVTPGATGQASVWVKSSSATARYRWVLRAVVDELDNCIVGYPSCSGEFTLAANTWTQLFLSDIQIPDNVSEMIFRVAYVGTTEPQAGTMRLTRAVYYEGLPAGTLGYILRTLYEDVVDPHDQADPIYWDNGAGTDTPYLTLDFDDTNDSAGVAWQDSLIQIEFLHEQPFLNCVTSATAKGGTSGPYVWRVVPNSAATGTWFLQVFNPGGDPAWDLSADDDCPVVRRGRDIVNRSARRFLPNATDIAYEGSTYQISRRRNDAAVTALGRIGGYVPDVDVPDPTTIGLAAEAELAVRLAGSLSLAYQLKPDATSPHPLVDYLPGYTIMVEDEPLIAMSGHVVDAIRVSQPARGGPTYEVHFDSESFVGSEAVSEGVRRLLAVFKGVRPDKEGGAGRSGGGVIPWLVVGSDAPQVYKDIAGYVCSGTNDERTIQACIDATAAAYTGEVWAGPGGYQIEVPAGAGAIILAYGVTLRGWDSPDGAGVYLGQSNAGETTGWMIQPAGDHSAVSGLFIETDGKGIYKSASTTNFRLTDCTIVSGEAAVDLNGGAITVERVEATTVSSTAAVKIDVEGSNSGRVVDCVVVSANIGIHILGGNQVWVQRCKANGCDKDGILVDYSGTGEEAQGIWITDNTLENVATTGTIGTHAGLRILGDPGATTGSDGGQSLWVERNRVYNSGAEGILVADGFQGSIADNTVQVMEGHGIKIAGDRLDVHDNQVSFHAEGSSTNTYDAIYVDGDYNYVHGNRCTDATTGTPNRFRYAVNIAAGTGNTPYLNFITGCGATADYADAGAGTITAPDANGQF